MSATETTSESLGFASLFTGCAHDLLMIGLTWHSLVTIVLVLGHVPNITGTSIQNLPLGREPIGVCPG